MNRRDFSKAVLAAGAVAAPGYQGAAEYYEEPSRKLPVRAVDVVVAGGGTAGVVAAVAAARQGARTMLVESKGYVGGTVVEGGTALHSFYNLWKPFPGVSKRNVVRGIPKELVDRLVKVGGATGYPETIRNFGYDSVGTSIDTEIYKLTAFEMLEEAGVFVAVNTLLAGAVRKGSRLDGVIAESRSGREMVRAKAFVDCTGYGDLSAHAGGKYSEPNDQPVCNSMGVANVDVEKLCRWLMSRDAVGDYVEGPRDGKEGQIVRLGGSAERVSPEFAAGLRALGATFVTTTVRDNYFMFIKVNMQLPVSPTSRDAVAKAEGELRRRQFRTVELFRKHLPGCEKAFIARTSPSLNIRRGRLIACDYDVTLPDVLEARHFDDDVMAYGFHDSAPRLQIRNGGTYGIPYRALRVAGIENLLAAGMLITSDHEAHMSTRNTVCAMGQGQAAGTAAARCAARNCGMRDLSYGAFRKALEQGGVYFEN
jgi:glycine/D-amino acid oxidase-like deaminating enzyme